MGNALSASGRSAYVEAVLNEAKVDADLAVAVGLTCEQPVSIPRPTLLPAWLLSRPRVLAIVMRVAARCWWPALFPSLLACQATRAILRKLDAGTTEPRSQTVLFGACPHVSEVAARLPARHATRTLLTLSGAWQPSGADMQSVELLGHCHWKDIPLCVWDAIRGAWAVRSAEHGVNLSLQGYVAFPWFLAWRSLHRIRKKVTHVITANHYDRWAILLDRHPAQFRITLVQHGLVGRRVPSRLSNVAEIHTYDEESAGFFRERYLTNCQPEFHRIRYSLQLTDLSAEQRTGLTALLIGHPQELEREREIIRRIQGDLPECRVYVKPHPLGHFGPYEELQGGNVKVILTKQCFPRVDVVISPESTLGCEYASCGIPVIWHRRTEIAEILNRLATLEEAGRSDRHNEAA